MTDKRALPEAWVTAFSSKSVLVPRAWAVLARPTTRQSNALNARPETEFHLGLVHSDGKENMCQHLELADKYISGYGIVFGIARL
ncbi:MAG: hypothetical protein JOZ29_10740 [Deltaproteobacteria bacterium]|nr:hypothetical protein [Deltaproteobacteria bacterium]